MTTRGDVGDAVDALGRAAARANPVRVDGAEASDRGRSLRDGRPQ